MSVYSSAALRDLFRQLDLAEVRQKEKVTDRYRKLIATVFADIVSHTPQFSGNLAQAWEIEFGPHTATGQGKSEGFRKNMFWAYIRGSVEPFQRGDSPAVGQALSRELPKLASLRWNSVVRIKNLVPYADEVEQGIGPERFIIGGNLEIRPENLYRNQVFMASYAQMKYSNLNNVVKIVKL